MISRNDPCWCGSGKKWKKCHFPHKADLDFERLKEKYFKQYKILLKTPDEIAGIRLASSLAASMLKKLCNAAKAGVSTNELHKYAMQLHQEAGATPAPLGYGHPPFPKAICTSLNEVICHGIPSDNRILQDGDIMNIDVSPILNGFYGDCSAMVMIGEVDPDKKKVVEVSKECLMRSIAILKPGVLLHEIGNVIEDYATSQGCSVVDEFVGHGVGRYFHEPPQVPHHYNELRIPLVEGMTFTIEPMINAGVREAKLLDDGWTAVTADGKPSAQWEHLILITKDGHEVLTQVA